MQDRASKIGQLQLVMLTWLRRQDITDLAVIDVTNDGLAPVETAPGITKADVRALEFRECSQHRWLWVGTVAGRGIRRGCPSQVSCGVGR